MKLAKSRPKPIFLYRAAYTDVLGRSDGSGDFVLGAALDPNDNTYLTGTTGASDFPVTTGAFQTSLAGDRNAFGAKLSSLPSPVILGITPVPAPNAAGSSAPVEAVL